MSETEKSIENSGTVYSTRRLNQFEWRADQSRGLRAARASAARAGLSGPRFQVRPAQASRPRLSPYEIRRPRFRLIFKIQL